MRRWMLRLFALVVAFGVVFIPCGCALYAQHDWTWTFGDSVVMRFPGGGAPTVYPLENSRHTWETGASYSDSNGFLVAYSNHDSVWNGLGQPMVNGKIYSDFFITQGAMLLPDPGNDSLLHLWIIAAGCGPASLCGSHHVIERFANTGRGEVLPGGLLPYPGSSNGLTERLHAVKHSDGKSWWVFQHDRDNSDFFRYLMTASGTGTAQVQSIGSVHGPHNWHGYGQMKFSQDGTRMLVVSMHGIVDVFSVDRCTGLLGNWIPLGDTLTGVHEAYYGCSFSPDGTKIYASTGDLAGSISLYQWDLSASDIPASRTLIYQDADSTYWGQHQLGPDGKIYITQQHALDSLSYANHALSVINDPDQSGLACNFQYLGLDLLGRRTSYNLPNLPNYNLGPLLAQTAEAGPAEVVVCAGDSVLLGYPDTTGGAVTYAWAAHPDIADTVKPRVWVRPAQSTWYYLTVVDSAFGIPCGVTRDSVHVTVVDSAGFVVADAGRDTVVCAGEAVMLGHGSVVPGWQYAWQPTGDTVANIMVTAAGTYTLTVSHPAPAAAVVVGGCLVDIDTVRVDTVERVTPGFAGNDTIICLGDSLRLGTGAWGMGPGWVYSWSPAAGIWWVDSASTVAWPPATQVYVLTATDTAAEGACAQVRDSVMVVVEEQNFPDFPNLQEVPFCPGEILTVGVASVSGFSYTWTPAAGLQNPYVSQTTVAPEVPVVYTLTATNDTARSENCRTRDYMVALATDGCLPQNVVTPNGDGINDVLDLGTFGVAVRLTVYDRWGGVVYASDAYMNDWPLPGSTVPETVYYYVLRVPNEGGKARVGEVMVLR